MKDWLYLSIHLRILDKNLKNYFCLEIVDKIFFFLQRLTLIVNQWVMKAVNPMTVLKQLIRYITDMTKISEQLKHITYHWLYKQLINTEATRLCSSENYRPDFMWLYFFLLKLLCN